MNTIEIPKSIGIIMDGNRRWAKSQGLPSLEGHRRGYEKLKEVIAWSRKTGITHLAVYAFSTENWNRSEEEVSYLMDLFRLMISSIVDEAKKENTRLLFIGERSRLPLDIQKAMINAEEITHACTGLTFTIALSYGGRQEIIDAIHRIPQERLMLLTEQEFSELIWTREIPDPDMIIRTSGEQRLSNFMPWQSVYSELFFTKTFWPDFSQEEFMGMINEFGLRQRRRGK